MTLPNKRLLSVAEEVRQDAIVADIGTDHAYLPIFLLKSGKVRYAYLTDINEGPLARATANAKEAGLQDKTRCILTDGISALSGLGITDFCICGMGGELICDILSCADFAKDESLKFILQPMSREGTLRSYLYAEGFTVEREIYSYDAGKYYVAFAVKYTGETRTLTQSEAEVGPDDAEIVNNSCHIGYINKKIKSYERIVEGKLKAGADCAEDKAILDAFRKRLNPIGG